MDVGTRRDRDIEDTARWSREASGPKGQSGKVVLVAPPMRPEVVYGSFSDWASVSPPTGLCYIASYLRQAGREVAIVDAEATGLNVEQTVEAVRAHRPQLVGLACKTLWMISAQRVADALRAAMPEVKIVAGGNHVSALPERTLEECPSMDFAVIGEGEVTTAELADALNGRGEVSDVAGLCYRDGDRIVRTPERARIMTLDELPMPAFDLLPDLATHYQPALTSVEKVPAFSIVASRGCPAQCTFCDRMVFGNRVTRHSPEYTVRMIEMLYHEHGIRYLLFDDDNLLLHRGHLHELLDRLMASDVRMPFTCQSRVDTIDPERVSRLKKAGCRMILFGIESGSPQILDAMKKRITVEQIREAIRITKAAGIKTFGFFILGYPGETEETMQETVDLIRELKLWDVGVFLFTPLPGSEAYADIDQFGEFDENWERMNALDEVVFTPTGLDEATLKKYSDRCFSACYMRPGQIFGLPLRCTSMTHFRATMRYLPKMIFG